MNAFSPASTFLPWLSFFSSLKCRLAIAIAAGCGSGLAHAAETSPASSAGGILQVLMGLTLVLGLMALLAWAIKRLNAGRPAGNAAIRIVGGVSVGTRERILVVEAAEQWIVVGVAPGSVNALTTMPRQQTGPVPAALPEANFPAWLGRALGRK